MEGFKGVLSFFSSAAFFARDAFQNNVRFGIGILESFKYCFFTLFKGPGKCNFILELQNCLTGFIEEPGRAKVTGCCLKYATDHLDIA